MCLVVLPNWKIIATRMLRPRGLCFHLYPFNFSNETSLIESLQAGDVAFTLTSAAPTVAFQPKMAVFDVPFLFKSSDTPQETMTNVFKVFDTDEVKGTLDYLSDVGVKGLGYLELGFRVMATKTEVKTLQDMSGLKIRTMENANHIDAWKALGANPTPMAYSEVFTAIEQGTIDGQEQPLLLSFCVALLPKYMITHTAPSTQQVKRTNILVNICALCVLYPVCYLCYTIS